MPMEYMNEESRRKATGADSTPVDCVVIQRKPIELLKMCFATYVSTTDSGNVQVTVPEVLSLAECDEVEALFGLITKRMRRNTSG